MIDYHNKVFSCKNNKDNEDITIETLFFYKQNGEIVQAKYFGGNVKYGEIIGLVNEQGSLQGSFCHSTYTSQSYGGVCMFTPKRMEDTRVVLLVKWCGADGKNIESEWLMEELIKEAFPPLF
nr:hypothetical protein [Neobacillus sp. Marseille-Q6967]